MSIVVVNSLAPMRLYRSLLFFTCMLMGCLSLEALKPPTLENGFHIELLSPQYGHEGMFTSEGGIIWSDDFRLQAKSITYFLRDGQAWIEASGDLSLFYERQLLVGERLSFNLTAREGTLYNGSLGMGSWYISSETINLLAGHTIQLNKALISSDPSRQSSWDLHAGSVRIHKKIIEMKHITFRAHRLPLFYFPSWSTTPQSLFDQPVEYDVVWKGSHKRRFSMRYRFFSNPFCELWTRLDYHVGKGPGLGLDGKLSLDNGIFETSNFIARDTGIGAPDINTRFRLKGHYHRQIAPTTSFDIYYDRYSDSDILSDYATAGFNQNSAGQTKVVLRDARTSFIHQISERFKINSFQTVKRELPSYFLTPHPLYAPRSLPGLDSCVFTSHWRGEYLAYDFQDRSPFNNYHSMRLFTQGNLSRPMRISGFQITPSVGYLAAGYNQTPRQRSAGVVAPTGGLRIQTQWHGGHNIDHLIVAYSDLNVIGNPRRSIDDHYIFDYRDAIAKVTRLSHGVRQEWQNQEGQVASLQVEQINLLHEMAAGQYAQFYRAEGTWLLIPTWRLGMQLSVPKQFRELSNLSIRTENTWNTKLATVLEYRQRASSCWKKNNPDDFSLETVRSRDELLQTDVSGPHRAFLTHFNYQLSPNWAFRFDTAHGWNRGWSSRNTSMKQLAYQQYCAGLGTDIGSNWRLQFQVTKSPKDWDWRIRLDLRDGPVTAPAPRF